jgi:hypothetical protein
MYLTDVLSEPTKWRIPDDTLIPPGGVLLLWADGEESEGPLHANFALNAGGGQIGPPSPPACGEGGRAPVIGGTVHTPTWPTAGSTVTVTTSITDEGTVTATLWYRAFAAGAQPPAPPAPPHAGRGGRADGPDEWDKLATCPTGSGQWYVGGILR